MGVGFQPSCGRPQQGSGSYTQPPALVGTDSTPLGRGAVPSGPCLLPLVRHWEEVVLPGCG